MKPANFPKRRQRRQLLAALRAGGINAQATGDIGHGSAAEVEACNVRLAQLLNVEV